MIMTLLSICYQCNVWNIPEMCSVSLVLLGNFLFCFNILSHLITRGVSWIIPLRQPDKEGGSSQIQSVVFVRIVLSIKICSLKFSD